MFFDMEGFPLIDDGREYLFGACYYEAGELRFRDWWAHSPAEEKRAFEAFVALGARAVEAASGAAHLSLQPLRSDGAAAADGKVRRVRTGGGRLLHGQVFVDLYRIVRQAVMIGEPSYSLKYVEHLYRGRREGDVASAGESMVFYQRWLDAAGGSTPETSAILKQIRDYNEQDCQSTAELAAWLWERQREAGITPSPRAADVAAGRTGPATATKGGSTVGAGDPRGVSGRTAGRRGGRAARVKELSGAPAGVPPPGRKADLVAAVRPDGDGRAAS